MLSRPSGRGCRPSIPGSGRLAASASTRFADGRRQRSHGSISTTVFARRQVRGPHRRRSRARPDAWRPENRGDDGRQGRARTRDQRPGGGTTCHRSAGGGRPKAASSAAPGTRPRRSSGSSDPDRRRDRCQARRRARRLIRLARAGLIPAHSPKASAVGPRTWQVVAPARDAHPPRSSAGPARSRSAAGGRLPSGSGSGRSSSRSEGCSGRRPSSRFCVGHRPAGENRSRSSATARRGRTLPARPASARA